MPGLLPSSTGARVLTSLSSPFAAALAYCRKASVEKKRVPCGPEDRLPEWRDGSCVLSLIDSPDGPCLSAL